MPCNSPVIPDSSVSPYMVTLRFDMTDPDARNACTLAIGAPGMANALAEIQEVVRQLAKYEDVSALNAEWVLSRVSAIVAAAIDDNCRDTLEAYQ